MMKTFHEAPICMMETVRTFTDGDYALAHLFEDNPDYVDFFKTSVKRGREVIVDNSAFELGHPVDWDYFAHWVREIKPTYYIVPDAIGDANKTIENFFSFTEHYPDLPGGRFAVIQGSTYEDVVRCYRALAPFADKIGFCLKYPFFEDLESATSVAFGRFKLLSDLESDGVIDKMKLHHLLGISVPGELSYYSLLPLKFYWLHSIDTSCPVSNGIEGVLFKNGLPNTKPKMLMADHINDKYDKETIFNVIDNILHFRSTINGELE